MARNQMWDNIRHVYRAELVITTTTGSEEIDLDLPKGVVARLTEVKFRLGNIEVPITSMSIHGALINDPDDEESYEIPDSEIEHDVICDCNFSTVMATSGRLLTGDGVGQETYEFGQEEDVIAFRNLRFNAIGTVDVAVKLEVIIAYHYEEVTSKLLLEIMGVK